MNILLKMPELEIPQPIPCESAPKPLKLMEVLSLALTDFETGPKKRTNNVWKCLQIKPSSPSEATLGNFYSTVDFFPNVRLL